MDSSIVVGVIALVVLVAGVLSAWRFWRPEQAPGAEEELRQLLRARRDGSVTDAEFEARQQQIHERLLDAPAGRRAGSRLGILMVCAGLAAAGLAALLWMGRSGEGPARATAPGAPMPTAPQAATAANTGGDMNAMVKRLADKLEKEPANAEGWLLLARAYAELRQAGPAAEAYAKAAKLMKPDAAFLADWADAYVLAHDQRWDEQARALVKQALAADARHLKALSLAGSEAFERKDYPAAIGFWQRMKDAAPADSMDARLAESNIGEARQRMAGDKAAK